MPANPSQFVCACVSVAKHVERPGVPLCDGCIAAVVWGLSKETEDKCRRALLWHPTVLSSLLSVGWTLCVFMHKHFFLRGNDGVSRAFEGK